MRFKADWRTILEYTAGIVVLVAAVAAAWFLPGLYAQHQDEHLLSEVELSSREEIQFLDVNSLEIAGRLKMLEDSEYFGWDFFDEIREDERAQIEEMARAGLKRWNENGLIGEVNEDWVFSDLFFGTVVYLDQGKIPLAIMRFRKAMHEENTEFWEEESWATVAMDRDNGMLYYVSVSGSAARDSMAQRMGFEDYGAYMDWDAGQEYEYFDDAGYTKRVSGGAIEEDLSGCDFASVCGAEASEIEGETQRRVDEVAYDYSVDVKLKFPTFDGSAYRREVLMDGGTGISIMYGTEEWLGLIEALMRSYGYVEYGYNAAADVVYSSDAKEEYNKMIMGEMVNESIGETEKDIR